MGNGVTLPERLNEEECRSLANAAGVDYDPDRFELLATTQDNGQRFVLRSQLIADISTHMTDHRGERRVAVPAVKILLPELVDTVEKAFSDGLTPLILDPSIGHNVDTFFRYSHTSIFDAKRVGLDAALGTGSEAEGLEEARQALVVAMKRGKTLVVSMQQSSPPFSSWLDKPDFFPATEVFTRAGQDLVSFDSEWPDKLFRAEDTADTHGFAIPHKDFRVVLTSWFAKAADVENFLFRQDQGLSAFDPALFQLILVVDMNGSDNHAFGGASRVQHHRSINTNSNSLEASVVEY